VGVAACGERTGGGLFGVAACGEQTGGGLFGMVACGEQTGGGLFNWWNIVWLLQAEYSVDS
jgi:hypothetical protein